MFCSTCGKDCAEYSFCPYCGAKVYRPEQQSGIPISKTEQLHCPRCFSTGIRVHTDDFFENNYYLIDGAGKKMVGLFAYLLRRNVRIEDGDLCSCLRCEYRWRIKEEKRNQQYKKHMQPILQGKPQVRIAAVNGRYIEVNESGITVYRDKKRRVIIPLKELAAVEYRDCYGFIPGRLTIRDRAHLKKKLPADISQAEKDRFTILFEAPYRVSCYQLYTVLKKITEQNKEEGLF